MMRGAILATLALLLGASGAACTGDCWPAGAAWPVECDEDAAGGDGPGGTDGGDDDGADDDAASDDDGTSDDDSVPSADGDISVLPDPLDFGEAGVGDELYRTLSIDNLGGAVLRVDSIVVDGGAEFGFSGPSLPRAIEPGARLDLTVTYAPTAAGSDAADLVIASDDPDEGTYRAALLGSAAGSVEDDDTGPDPESGDIEVTPMTVDFGRVDEDFVVEVFTIRNVGSGALTVHGVSFDPSSSTAGEVTFSGVPSTLAAGAQATVTARWETDSVVPWALGPGDCLDYLGGSTAVVSSDSPSEGSVLVDLEGCCDSEGFGVCFLPNAASVFSCLAGTHDFNDLWDCF